MSQTDINTYLQARLASEGKSEVTAVEAARWLDEAGILRDSPQRPGKALRDLLSAGDRIEGAVQRPPGKNGRWYVRRLGDVPSPAEGEEASPAAARGRKGSPPPAPSVRDVASPSAEDRREGPRYRVRALLLDSSVIPANPGVYFFYSGNRRVYIGKAGGKDGLRQRMFNSHLQTGSNLRNSAFRRNAAQALGFASGHDLSTGRARLTGDQLNQLNEWVAGLEVSWIVCRSDEDANELWRRWKGN